jgi:hypothetical protein
MTPETPVQRFAAYMARTPQGEPPADHVRTHHLHRLRSPAARFRSNVAEALVDWRMIRHRFDRFKIPEVEILFQAGVAEILALRLEAAHAPIFRTLDRIDRRLIQVQILAGPTHHDPFAPPKLRGWSNL